MMLTRIIFALRARGEMMTADFGEVTALEAQGEFVEEVGDLRRRFIGELGAEQRGQAFRVHHR